jgi:hypothetical protein
MNGVSENGNIASKTWLDDQEWLLKNPLIINGRLLTYNTRWGSLINNNGELEKATGATDMCASDKVIAACDNLTTAALQDLERFRVVMQVPAELNNRCTLHVTGVMALNRPNILLRTGF